MEVMEGHTDSVNAVSITPDGERAVSGNSNGTLRVWNLATGKCMEVMEGHIDRINAISITPDGKRIVLGSNNTIVVWNLVTWECLKVIKMPEYIINNTNIKDLGRVSRYLISKIEKEMKFANQLTATAVTPDGRWMVSGNRRYTLTVWDLFTGKYLDETTILPRNVDPWIYKLFGVSINAVSITPDGRKAIAGGDDKTLYVWDLASPKIKDTGDRLKVEDDPPSFYGNNERSLEMLKGHTGTIKAISITPNGEQVVSGSSDGTLQVWNLATGKCMKVMEGHTDSVNAVSITPDGERAVSGSSDKTIRVWELANGKCLMVYGMEGSIWDVAVHGTGLVVGVDGGQVAFVTMENYCRGRFIITATRLWLFDKQLWDAKLTALCPWCGGRFDADPYFNAVNPDFGQGSSNARKTYTLKSPDINCPLPGCNKPLRLNPFVCDHSGY